MTEYTINITDQYETPTTRMTKEQYLNFVMNRAAESYKKQYGTETVDAGIQAACDLYNESLPPETVQEEPQVEEVPEENEVVEEDILEDQVLEEPMEE
jgi:hypothetical protein